MSGSLNVNAEMVKQGAAWVYRQYLKDQSLLALEQQAKAAQRGLWGLPETERCPPWDWRKGTCATASALAPAGRAPAAPDFSRQQRRFHLRRQAVLPRNDELRGGEVLPHVVRRGVAGWEQGRRTV
jgi:hypothetical protein